MVKLYMSSDMSMCKGMIMKKSETKSNKNKDNKNNSKKSSKKKK